MLIDTHAHLDVYATGREQRAALSEIEKERIVTLGVSVDEASYKRNRTIAKQCQYVVPAFGIHPREAPKHQRHLDSFRALIDETPIIGEIGLDHRHVKDTDLWPAQRRVFAFFLEAAREQKKIVNVHTSGAESEVLEMLDEYDIERAIIHWYNGPEEAFRRLAARGYLFTFGVELRTSQHIQALAKECPAEQFLTETDNPGGAKWLYGEQGMPRLIGGVIQQLAKVREAAPAAIVEQVQANFLRLIAPDEALASVREKFA